MGELLKAGKEQIEWGIELIEMGAAEPGQGSLRALRAKAADAWEMRLHEELAAMGKPDLSEIARRLEEEFGKGDPAENPASYGLSGDALIRMALPENGSLAGADVVRGKIAGTPGLIELDGELMKRWRSLPMMARNAINRASPEEIGEVLFAPKSEGEREFMERAAGVSGEWLEKREMKGFAGGVGVLVGVAMGGVAMAAIAMAIPQIGATLLVGLLARGAYFGAKDAEEEKSTASRWAGGVGKAWDELMDAGAKGLMSLPPMERMGVLFETGKMAVDDRKEMDIRLKDLGGDGFEASLKKFRERKGEGMAGPETEPPKMKSP